MCRRHGPTADIEVHWGSPYCGAVGSGRQGASWVRWMKSNGWRRPIWSFLSWGRLHRRAGSGPRPSFGLSHVPTSVLPCPGRWPRREPHVAPTPTSVSMLRRDAPASRSTRIAPQPPNGSPSYSAHVAQRRATTTKSASPSPDLDAPATSAAGPRPKYRASRSRISTSSARRRSGVHAMDSSP